MELRFTWGIVNLDQTFIYKDNMFRPVWSYDNAHLSIIIAIAEKKILHIEDQGSL